MLSPDNNRHSAADFAVAIVPGVFVVLWASGFIGSKLGLPYAEPMTFLSLRMIALVVLLGLLIAVTRPPWPSGAGVLHNAAAGAMVHGLYLGGVFVSIYNELPAGLTALVVALQPVLTSTLANRWLGERVLPQQWIGLLLGLLGVYLVLHEKLGSGSTTLMSWAGAGVALVAITVGTLYQKRFCGGTDWRSGFFIQYGATLIMCGTAALIFESRVVQWTPQFIFALAWLAFPLSLGAVWLLYFMIRRSAATRVASFFYLTPPLTALMAWALFDERLGPLSLFGMAVCVAGVFLVNWRVAPPAPR